MGLLVIVKYFLWIYIALINAYIAFKGSYFLEKMIFKLFKRCDP